MTRAGEGVELMRLSELVERAGELSHLRWCRALVIGTEQAKQRARQVLRHPDEWFHARRSALRHVYNCAAVAVDRRVELQAARRQEGLPAAGTVADDADLAVAALQRLQVGSRS